MSDFKFTALALLILVGVVLLVFLLVRKPRFEMPSEILGQLARMEQASQAIRDAVAKNDGALDSIANQSQGIAQNTATSVDGIRQAVDEKLAANINESRSGLTQLLEVFAQFEAKLDQRLSSVDSLMAQRFDALQTGTVATLDNSRKALDERLLQTQADATNGRKEFFDVLASFRTELAATLGKLVDETLQSRTALIEGAKARGAPAKKNNGIGTMSNRLVSP